MSNWISYKRFDFVCYETIEPTYGESTYTHRLCGLPGDTVELRNGVLYVNNRNVDRSLDIKNNYMISLSTWEQAQGIDAVDYIYRTPYPSDSVCVSMTKSVAKRFLNAQRIINNTSNQLHMQFPKNWTLDNFGPMILPDNKVFFLGDNRSNSIDSRMFGLKEIDDIVGVVMNKN